ncbi:MAG: hypothetical protein J6Z27_00355 [Bacteroidales bacterium]|nr:hypothetical protein [Bacteroidales bacterium]
MRRLLKHIPRIIRIALALSPVLLMAVSCPDPLPSNEDAIIETDDLISFKMVSFHGLYIEGKNIVVDDGLNYQSAWKWDGTEYRIQRDDQRAFLQIVHPVADSVTTFMITYMPDGGDVNAISLEMRSVKKNEYDQWWWNDVEHTGLLIPR